MQHAIESRERKLDGFFERAKKLPADDEVTSDLAKLGAVLACGYVERCVELVILNRLAQLAQDRVLSFIKTHFKKGTNYDCEAIAQLLARFDPTWADRFRDEIKKNEESASSLNSLYSLRNSVAHGGDQNRGLAGVETLYKDCKFVVLALVDATRG